MGGKALTETDRAPHMRHTITHASFVRVLLLSAFAVANLCTISIGAEPPRPNDVNVNAGGTQGSAGKEDSGWLDGANLSLKEGILLYDDGDFNSAISKFLEAEMEAQASSIRVEALKYAAFSYCVTARADLCLRAFERALKIDRTFKLTMGEARHPMWGPIFVRASKKRASLPRSSVQNKVAKKPFRELKAISGVQVSTEEKIPALPDIVEKIFSPGAQPHQVQQDERWRHADVWRSH